MHTKIITILITGIVFTAGLIMGFGGYVFAGDPVPGLDITIEQIPGGRVSTKNYNSSLSNKSIGQVRMEVGNVLLRYGVGGANINQVTETLEGGGVYEAELESFLIAIGMNEKDTQDILLEFDKLGISKEGAQAISPGTGDVSPSAAEGTIKDILPSKRTENVKKEFSGLESEIRNFFDRYEEGKSKAMQDLKAAKSKEQYENVKQELKYRRVLLQQGVQALHQDLRENVQELRDNFRENVKTTIGHVDHGKTARIAVAHGKGLRMINRYRSAIARFDHILGRLESRVEKLEARGIDISSVIPLIEEAKNMQVENEAKLVELEAKYELLLLGKNPGGVAEEARAIAKELKAEIEKLHILLDDIKQAATDYNSSVSNSSSTL